MNLTRAAIVILALFAGAGCSTDAPVQPAPVASSTTGQLTREQGAAEYTRLVDPYNEALDRCLPVLNPVLDSEKPLDLPKLRKACEDMPEANRGFSKGLSNAHWPTEAQESVRQLIDELNADQLAWQGIADAHSADEVFNPKYPLTEDGEAADLVRAHLGLPATTKIKE